MDNNNNNNNNNNITAMVINNVTQFTIESRPFVRILHQPSHSYHMRYKSEKRSQFLYAEHEEEDGAKLFPKVQIINACGPATLIVSCVSMSSPFYPHPHKLVYDSKNCNKSGSYVKHIDAGETIFE